MGLNVTNLTKMVGPMVGKTILQAKKISPELLLGTGIVGFVATNVLSSRATLKLEDVLEDFGDNIDAVKVKHENTARELLKIKDVQHHSEENFSIEVKETALSKTEYRAELTKVYIQGGFQLVKLYAPAIIVGSLSIAALLGSHTIMRNRNVALMAAYQTVSSAYSKYQDLVKEKLGEEGERELRLESLLKEEKVETKDGKTEKAVVKLGDPEAHSPYARFFDESSVRWEKDANHNLLYLRAQQSYFTDMLRARGSVMLNEVYDALGLPRTKAGAIVGWVINGEGDNYVDFGIYDINNPAGRAFVNGLERSILLDFNVDGVVYDKLDD